MEQQLGALLQAQQVMQQNMIEVMNRIAGMVPPVRSVERREHDKKEKLDWHAMGEMK